MKNKKGFTLIELLAVIVILGLLMAIAIPSVTRYITKSRKKTLITTIANYVSSTITAVNDMTYTFTETNTIYALPIECISTERAGANPFGEWMQANEEYYAYVLIQYNEENSSYKYGFTFKDSSGYGMYPVIHNLIEEKGKDIQTGLGLTQPKNGLASYFLGSQHWENSGFIFDENTKLQVLEATTDGEIGDGYSTCTLKQKSSNYDLVEQKKKDKYAIGNELCFKEECFYIIDSSTSKVTLLAKDKIELTLINPKQNPNADGILFAKTNYWAAESGLKYDVKKEYGSSYPVFVYDENSSIYPYLEAYEKYLKTLGIKSVEVSLINEKQVTSITSQNKTLLTKDYSWWTGMAYTSWHTYFYQANGNYAYVNYRLKQGIRPIITVAKADIIIQ